MAQNHRTILPPISSVALAATAWLVASGCSVSHKTVVKPSQAPAKLQTATKIQLVDKYNRQADSIYSVNLSVKMKLTGGSNYSGVIEQYHEVSGFMLAAKPANIRVIGQAPVVGKNIFDMVSNGEEFHVFIPSKNDFIVDLPACSVRRKSRLKICGRSIWWTRFSGLPFRIAFPCSSNRRTNPNRDSTY